MSKKIEKKLNNLLKEHFSGRYPLVPIVLTGHSESINPNSYCATIKNHPFNGKEELDRNNFKLHLNFLIGYTYAKRLTNNKNMFKVYIPMILNEISLALYNKYNSLSLSLLKVKFKKFKELEDYAAYQLEVEVK